MLKRSLLVQCRAPRNLRRIHPAQPNVMGRKYEYNLDAEQGGAFLQVPGIKCTPVETLITSPQAAV